MTIIDEDKIKELSQEIRERVSCVLGQYTKDIRQTIALMKRGEIARRYLQKCVDDIGVEFSMMEKCFELDNQLKTPVVLGSMYEHAENAVLYAESVTGQPNPELGQLLTKYCEFDVKSNEMEFDQ